MCLPLIFSDAFLAISRPSWIYQPTSISENNLQEVPIEQRFYQAKPVESLY